MNKLLMIYGCLLISGTAVAEEQQSTTLVAQTTAKTVSTFERNYTVLNSNTEIIKDSFTLNLDEIEFIEKESEIDLGFDTSNYLPEDFNPYEIYFDLNSIIYIEDENELQLDFDATYNLPEGFDPYTDIVGVESINYVEDEAIELGFNTAHYLPEGFSPYEAYFDLNSIEYIEDEGEEMEMDLGFKVICFSLHKNGINAD
nr:hypothetical protein [uncultured Allomuricauda sp.]